VSVAAAPVEAEADGYVRLVAAEPSGAEPDQVAALLGDDPPWAELVPESSPGPGLRRYATDLRLSVGQDMAPSLFRKAAFLDLGVPRRTDHGWRVEVGWRAASAAPLFPVFSGWLTIGRDEMRIDGLYAPPGGLIGRVADRMLLHVAASATARWLLRRIDEAAVERPGRPLVD
jgi:hypothetical protein